MKKDIQVVMLPTKKETNIIFDKGVLEFIEKKQVASTINSDVKGFHLYFLSDDKPKKGDWCYDISIERRLVKYSELPKHWHDSQQKIVATTDESLENVSNSINPVYEKLPQPTKEFIQKYIEQHNNKNILDWLEVEYDCNHNQMPSKVIDVLKINPDNTIDFYIPNLLDVPNKEVFSKEEVISLLYKSRFHINSSDEKFDKWISEVLR